MIVLTGSLMMALKRVHNNGIETVQKSSTMMVLERFLNDGTKRFYSDGTKKVP